MARLFRFAGGILGFVMLLFGVLNVFVGPEGAVRRWAFSLGWIAMGLVFLRYAIRGDGPAGSGKQSDRTHNGD